MAGGSRYSMVGSRGGSHAVSPQVIHLVILTLGMGSPAKKSVRVYICLSPPKSRTRAATALFNS